MKSAGLSLLLLAAAPLSAQRFETGLFLGQQQYDSYTYGVRGPSTLGAAPEANRVVAGRFGVSVADFGPARMMLTVGLQPEKSTPTRNLGFQPNSEELQYSYYSIGVGVAMTSVVALSVNVELRSESLDQFSSSSSFSGSHASTTWNRPWLRFNLSYTFPTAGIKPFIGLEVASALTSQSHPTYGQDTTEILLKAMAPKSQSGVYLGVRF